jgi:hypothetical protein
MRSTGAVGGHPSYHRPPIERSGKKSYYDAAPIIQNMIMPFEDGVAAYERGDYATAMRLWRPLAEQGKPIYAHLRSEPCVGSGRLVYSGSSLSRSIPCSHACRMKVTARRQRERRQEIKAVRARESARTAASRCPSTAAPIRPPATRPVAKRCSANGIVSARSPVARLHPPMMKQPFLGGRSRVNFGGINSYFDGCLRYCSLNAQLG